MEYIKYIPLELRDIEEYKQLGYAGDPEIIKAKDKIKEQFDNRFYGSANEYGISRYEKIMDITPAYGASLEDRRATVIAKSNNEIPYTLRVLGRMLVAILGNNGFTMDMEYNIYRLTIKLYRENKDKLEYVRKEIEDVIPANIELVLIVDSNTWDDVYDYGTWDDIYEFTWDEVMSSLEIKGG